MQLPRLTSRPCIVSVMAGFLGLMYYFSDQVDLIHTFGPVAPNVTVVTSFINIGDHQKGTGSVRKAEHYLEWMKIWQKVKNGVVFYTNDIEYELRFREIRAINKLPTTAVLIDIDTNDTSLNVQDPLWSVSLLPNITQIFHRPGYPKHHPNTVYPMYSVVMSLKYDALEQAILSNPFSTSYFAWIDVGIYRDDQLSVPCFRVELPPGFDQQRIAVNRVDQFRPNLSVHDIISNNRIWTGGGVLLGHKTTMLKFIKQYRAAAEAMIQRGWFSTDQQTIYGMFSDRSLNVPLDVELQIYANNGARAIPHFNGNYWWYLGYLIRTDENC